MKKFLAMTLSIIMTCAALTACGDTAQPSEESKAETTTTTAAAETTTTETTTETPAETEETTTTTTATETETTTTTEAAEESETATETEAPSENPEETSIVTYPDNDEGLYPMPECFRRFVEDKSKSKVVSIEFEDVVGTYVATISDGTKFGFSKHDDSLALYESDGLFSTDDMYLTVTDDMYLDELPEYRFCVIYQKN